MATEKKPTTQEEIKVRLTTAEQEIQQVKTAQATMQEGQLRLQEGQTQVKSDISEMKTAQAVQGQVLLNLEKTTSDGFDGLGKQISDKESAQAQEREAQLKRDLEVKTTQAKNRTSVIIALIGAIAALLVAIVKLWPSIEAAAK